MWLILSKQDNRRKVRQHVKIRLWRFNHSSSLQPIMPCLYAVCCKITSLSFTRVSGWTLNGIWSFSSPCLQAPRLPLRRVTKSPPLQVKRFRVGLPCYRMIPSNLKVLAKRGSVFPETFMACAYFPGLPYGKKKFPIGETLFQVSAFVYKMQIMLTQHGREF